MWKPTIAILNGIALQTVLTGLVLALGAVTSCSTFAHGQSVGCTTAISVAALMAASLIVLGPVAGVAGWVLALIQTVRTGRWGWFIAALLLSPLAALAYGLWGPGAHAA
jgi:hypothetical protein